MSCRRRASALAIIIVLIGVAGCGSNLQHATYYAEFGADVSMPPVAGAMVDGAAMVDARGHWIPPGQLLTGAMADEQLAAIAAAYRTAGRDMLQASSVQKSVSTVGLVCGSIATGIRLVASERAVMRDQSRYDAVGVGGLVVQALGIISLDRAHAGDTEANRLLDWAQTVEVYRLARNR